MANHRPALNNKPDPYKAVRFEVMKKFEVIRAAASSAGDTLNFQEAYGMIEDQMRELRFILARDWDKQR